MRWLRGLFSRPAAAPARVAVRTGSVVTEIGAPAILEALFSTIRVRLDGDGPDSPYPLVMGPLYQGRLEAAQAAAALEELREIEARLRALPADRVVWDSSRPGEPPSAFYRAPPDAASAAAFLVTVNGLELLRGCLIDSLESAVEFGDAVDIIRFESPADFFQGR